MTRYVLRISSSSSNNFGMRIGPVIHGPFARYKPNPNNGLPTRHVRVNGPPEWVHLSSHLFAFCEQTVGLGPLTINMPHAPITNLNRAPYKHPTIYSTQFLRRWPIELEL